MLSGTPQRDTSGPALPYFTEENVVRPIAAQVVRGMGWEPAVRKFLDNPMESVRPEWKESYPTTYWALKKMFPILTAGLKPPLLGSSPEEMIQGNIPFGAAGTFAGKKANGITVFTGANKPFTKFDTSLIGTRTDPGFAGRGAYTTTDMGKASRWGNHVMLTEIPETANLIKINKLSDLYESYGMRQMTEAERKLPQDKIKKVYEGIVNDFSDRMRKQGYEGVEWSMSSGDKQYVIFEPDKLNWIPQGVKK